jgi:23S rRNA maturation mini-RNase III
VIGYLYLTDPPRLEQLLQRISFLPEEEISKQ